MGYARARGLLGDARRKKVEEVEFLVDSSAFYTIISIDFAERLGIESMAETELMLADKRKTKAGVSLAYLKLMDREGVFQVAIMDAPEPLLGITVLEGLGLKVDPATGKLEYSRSYGLAVLWAI